MKEKPEERGQGLVEYGLLLVLIAMVVILVLALVGDSIKNLWENAVLPLMDVFTGSPYPGP